MKTKFYLNKREGKLFGVCAGIADYTGWDVTLIRVAVVVATVVGGFPWTLIAYAAAAFVAKQAAPEVGYGYDEALPPPRRTSTAELRETMRDIDRRMAEVETFVTSPNQRLAQEIESLR